MTVYTCTRGGTDHRCQTQTVLQAAGEREAIICPTHGVIAYAGFKPASGVAAVRKLDGTDPATLLQGEIAKVGTQWWLRTPAGGLLLLAVPYVENPDTTLTVQRVIDSQGWRGWLENTVWIKEER